jgi:hypothetical protein
MSSYCDRIFYGLLTASGSPDPSWKLWDAWTLEMDADGHGSNELLLGFISSKKVLDERHTSR